MADFFRRRFRWKNGQVVVELPDDEQDMLRHVLPQLRELVMGETDEGVPAALVSGLPADDRNQPAATALRAPDEDLFL